MSPTRKYSIGIAAALACALLILFFATRGKRERDGEFSGAAKDDARTSGGTDLDSPAVQFDARVPTATTALVAPSTTTEPTFRRVGRTVDATFGVPTAARVEPDRGAIAFSNPVDGVFALGSSSAEWAELIADAPGFETRRVQRSSVGESDPLEIALEPASRATVRVRRASGEPQSDCAVTWHAAVDRPERQQVRDWVSTAGHVSGKFKESKTDEQGAATAAIGHPAYAVVTDPRSGAKKTVRMLPGAETLVVLPESAVNMLVVDAGSRTPIGRLELEIWFPAEIDSMSQRVETDDRGHAPLWISSLPVLIRRPGAELYLSRLTPLSPGSTSAGTGGRVMTMLRVAELPAAGPLLVGVSSCGPALRLVNARDASAVDGLARVVLRRRGECAEVGGAITQCTLKSARSAFVDPDQRYRVRAGRLPLSCLLDDSPAARAGGPLELVLSADGFRPCVITWSLPPSAPDAPAFEVQLEPCETKTLLAVRSDGRPFRGSIAVYSPQFDTLLWSSPGAEDGRHGALDWFGGELWVSAGDDKTWKLRLAADELASAPTVTLEVPTATGALVIDGAPEGYPFAALVAKSGVGLYGVEFQPSSSTASSCRFDALPVGSYTVGPRLWVESAELQPITLQWEFEIMDHTARIHVREGETTTVSWLSVWALGSPTSGQVRILGSDARMMLVPQYGPLEPNTAERDAGDSRFLLGRNSPRLALDEHGRYSIGALDPLPKLIAVCILTDGLWGAVQGMQVLETMLPGESIDIATGTLELSWASESTHRELSVLVEVQANSLRYPVSTGHTKRELRWNTAQPLAIPCVPLTVRRVVIGGREQPVSPELNRVSRVSVEFDALAPAAK